MEETSISLAGDFSSPLARALQDSLTRALALESELPPWVLDLEGMSGRKYRRLINNLVAAVEDPRYLEIGSWAGSTACAAMANNQVRAVCIDNWSEFGGPKHLFHEATGRAISADIDFRFIESDFRAVDYSSLSSFNVYLYDGPHTDQDQYDGVLIAQPALDDDYIQIVDDWNWPGVRSGTLSALEAAGAGIVCSVEIRTTQDDSHPVRSIQKDSEWHNGYFIAVVRKASLTG